MIFYRTKLNISLILLILLPYMAVAQPKVGTPIKSKYQQYTHPLGPTGTVYKPYEMTQLVNAARFWVVYADRDNITTYQTPEGKVPAKKIKFMDAFYVTDVTMNGTYVQIVKYDNDIVDYNTRKLNSKFDVTKSYYGWVPSSNLLMWDASLIDRETKFIIKALTVHKPEALVNPTQYAEKNQVKLYNMPDLSASSKSENVIQLFNFYYIYKMDTAKNSYLIGKNFEIDDPKEAPRKILGWVSSNVIQLWSKRLCFETNSEKAAIRERSAKSVYPCIFRTKEEAAAYNKGLPIDTGKVLKYFGVDYPFRSYTKRLPILSQSDKDTNLFQTAFITSIYNDRNEEVSSIDEHNESEKNFNSQSHYVRNVNLIFVLGGSPNVKAYYSEISEGIRSAADKLQKSYSSSNSFKYGCVVYNHSDDKKCNQEVMAQELTSDVDKVNYFIESYSNKKTFCSGSTSPYYALHSGLNKACYLLADHAKETNILVIIGDAGSSIEDAKLLEKDLISKIESLKCGLLVYQVTNPGSDPFDYFYRQIKRIATTSNEEINNKYISKLIKSNIPKLEQLPSGNAWTIFEFDPATSALFGRFKFAASKNLDPADISDDLNRTVLKVNENINLLIENTQDYITGAGEKVRSINPSMALFLKDMGYDLNDPGFISQLNGDNFQFCIPGYLSLHRTGLDNDIFRYNVFVTGEEYFSIKKLMDDIVSTFNNGGTDLRVKLADIYRETVKQYLGGIESDKIIDKMSPDSIMYYVTGIHTRSEIFKKYKIKDFANPKTFSNNELKGLVDIIRDKREKLVSIETDNAYHKFEMDKKIYYWIPDDYLP